MHMIAIVFIQHINSIQNGKRIFAYETINPNYNPYDYLAKHQTYSFIWSRIPLLYGLMLNKINTHYVPPDTPDSAFALDTVTIGVPKNCSFINELNVV